MRTPEPDEQFRWSYRRYAHLYALQYYVSGRFAINAQLAMIGAISLRHALELLLKCCLAKDDTTAEIRLYGARRQGYYHDLLKLWSELKARNGTIDLTSHDETVRALHEFDEVRYPDDLLSMTTNLGTALTDNTSLIDANLPAPAGTRTLVLVLPRIDCLFAAVLPLTGYGRVLLDHDVPEGEARRYYNLRNTAMQIQDSVDGLPIDQDQLVPRSQ